METPDNNIPIISNVTFFSGFNQPCENKSIDLVFDEIKKDIYKNPVQSIRFLINQGNSTKADALKKQLPAFTPSATYVGGRKQEFIKTYSGFVHLDFDKLPLDQLGEIFIKITQIPFTYACFHSPTGTGIKVFIQVNTGSELHPNAYKQVQEYYEKILGIQADSKCKDIARLCFVSYDPDTFINVTPEIFSIQQSEPGLIEKSARPEIPDYKSVFEDCVRFTENKGQYINGNRNNFIYQLASNCNRKGIPENVVYSFISTKYDLPEKEIQNAIKSTYKNHVFEFAKAAKFAKLQNESTKEPVEDYLKQTPFIPDEIFDLLPDLLKFGCNAFQDKRERDVFLTGALSILSGCFPEVIGIYDRQIVYPNLNCFIIAPAASGKSALKFAKMLAAKEHSNILQKSRDDAKSYEGEIIEYRKKQSNNKKITLCEEPPLEPPFKVLFIPANASYAKILWHLDQNQGNGIICETEADTMGNVLKQDWGSYSDMLRKSFHHEDLSSSKKTNNEYIEVNSPRLSVALSGTPSQVAGLIGSSEDGLFSRLMFYVYKVDQVWRDVSPYASAINLTDHFEKLSVNVTNIINFLNQYPTTIELSKDQWNKLNSTCGLWLNEVTMLNGDDSGSIIKRLGLILFRIAMIFTALRKLENGDTSINVTCTDSDFRIAIKLVQVYLEHSLFMYNNLPKQDQLSNFRGGSNKQKFFDELPKEFKRAEAVEIGKRHKISSRSVDDLLKNLQPKFLSQETFGKYIRV